MQGRTNVKDGIALNATISEMEVYGGNIVAGDFVEYKTVAQKESFLPTDVYNSYVDLGNNKYVLGAGYYLYLVELVDGTYNILHSLGINNARKMRMCKYNNEYIFVGVNFSSTYELEVIRISNNQLSIYNSLPISKYIYTGLHFDSNSRKILLISSAQHGFVSVDSNMELHDPTWKNNPSGLTYWGSNSYWKGNILIASVKSDNSSSYTYLRKFLVDYVNETITLNTTLQDNLTWDSMTGYLIGDYLVLAGATSTGSSPYKTLYSIDINSMALSEYKSLWNNGMNPSGGVIDNTYFVSIVGYSALRMWFFMFSVDIETGIISRVVDDTLVSSIPYDLIIGKNNIMYCIGQDIGYLSYNDGHDFVTDKEDKDYVKAYTGGKAIGVAKQSGVVGETIEVYVPSV